MKPPSMLLVMSCLIILVPTPATSETAAHEDWLIAGLEAQLSALAVEQGLDLPPLAALLDPDSAHYSADLDGFVQAARARLGPTSSDTRASPPASPEVGNFPMASDIILYQSYFGLNPPPNDAACNQSPANGAGGHYDLAGANTGGSTSLPYKGVATSRWGTVSGTFNMVLQLPLGTFGPSNLGVPPAKAFTFAKDIRYYGESDFYCRGELVCIPAQGICFYAQVNAPYLRGLVRAL